MGANTLNMRNVLYFLCLCLYFLFIIEMSMWSTMKALNSGFELENDGEESGGEWGIDPPSRRGVI